MTKQFGEYLQVSVENGLVVMSSPKVFLRTKFFLAPHQVGPFCDLLYEAAIEAAKHDPFQSNLDL